MVCVSVYTRRAFVEGRKKKKMRGGILPRCDNKTILRMEQCALSLSLSRLEFRASRERESFLLRHNARWGLAPAFVGDYIRGGRIVEGYFIYFLPCDSRFSALGFPRIRWWLVGWDFTMRCAIIAAIKVEKEVGWVCLARPARIKRKKVF